MFEDLSGRFIISALIIGVIAGVTIGGTVGGIVSYNAAKESGLDGSELALETIKGVATGAVVGGIIGELAGATVAARAVEVAALQCKKSNNDNKSGWQIANDIITSVYSNAGRILSPTGMKAVTTTNGYIGYYKTKAVYFSEYARAKEHIALSYAFAAYAWYQTYKSIKTVDPVQRAYQRGYTLN